MTRPRGRAIVLRGDALNLPLADDSVDLIVTSPPYFALRSYEDGGEHYAGQIGDEPTPDDYVEALLAVTAECARVLKPTGSLFVNLGDKYAERAGPARPAKIGEQHNPQYRQANRPARGRRGDVRAKSLIGLPWRYALGCIDELGLIARAEVIWDKPNRMPESIDDRVVRAHESFLHLTTHPRYYAELDPLREPYDEATAARYAAGYSANADSEAARLSTGYSHQDGGPSEVNPLGKLPDSVWTVPTQPFAAPDVSPIDGRPLPRHFAAFPMEWPRRLITGWSPSSYCLECGEPRRPRVTRHKLTRASSSRGTRVPDKPDGREGRKASVSSRIVGERCACGDKPTAPTRPAVVLDPFGGTGTTALVAAALGRLGIAVDLSHDYARLALWRTRDPEQRARAAERPLRRTPTSHRAGEGQLELLA